MGDFGGILSLIQAYGSKAAGRKKSALNVGNYPSLKVSPCPTIHPTDLGLLPSWISISRATAQEFSPSWNARNRVQEGLKFQEIPGNLYFQKTAENQLKSGKLKKIRPLLL